MVIECPVPQNIWKLKYVLSIFRTSFKTCMVEFLFCRLVLSRAVGRVWDGWARAHQLFGENRVKHMAGPTHFFYIGPTHFQNPTYSPESKILDFLNVRTF